MRAKKRAVRRTGFAALNVFALCIGDPFRKVEEIRKIIQTAQRPLTGAPERDAIFVVEVAFGDPFASRVSGPVRSRVLHFSRCSGRPERVAKCFRAAI